MGCVFCASALFFCPVHSLLCANCCCCLTFFFIVKLIRLSTFLLLEIVTMYFDFEWDCWPWPYRARAQLQKSNANFSVTAPSLQKRFLFGTRHVFFLTLSLPSSLNAYYRPHCVQYLINKICVFVLFALLFWMSMSPFPLV